MPWEPDPNDPLDESPKAVWRRVFSIGLPFLAFIVILIVAVVKGG